MNTIHGHSRSLSLLAFAGLSAVAVAFAVGAPIGQAADPFVAGGLSTRRVALATTDADRAKARGRTLAVTLGLPGVRQTAVRLDDRFEHRTYDEVTSFDATGRAVAVSRFEPGGAVAMALVLGWNPGRGNAVDHSAAGARGLAVARAAGLSMSGAATVVASTGSGGWSVAWQRVVDGVPVRGDGVRVALWADGSFHGLSRMERPLSATPAQSIAAGTAKQIAQTWIGGRFGSEASNVRIIAVDRAWVAPNDVFGASRADAPAEVLRLAWIVRLETRGVPAEHLRSVELWLDAGDGALIGGDVIE
jgi:hypothetical protein